MTVEGTWDTICDVVVVGSGAGAMAGAVHAASRGLRTLVLEKTARLGGTSAYSGASLWLPGSAVQRRAGVADSTESARTYLRALLGDRDEEKREAFLESAPRVVADLERDPAIEFEWRPFPEYFARPGRVETGRSINPLDLPADRLGPLLDLVRPEVGRDRAGLPHRDAPLTAGRALIGRLLLALTSGGTGSVRTGVRVTELVVEDGRIVGVVGETDDGPIRVRAERGVLLAAGGFEGDAGMRARHGVPGSAEWTMAPRGANTGDAIRAAMAVGADTELMDQGWWCPGMRSPDGSAAFTLGFRGGVVVDVHGARFANESQPYDRMGRAMAAAPGRVPAYLVFDSRYGGAVPALSQPARSTEEQLASGSLTSADTLTELAERLGLPSGALEATVDRFNGFAARGVDQDFHRGEDPYDLFFADRSLDHPNPCLVPLERAPYRAVPLVLSDLGTKGGLRTDTEARVLDRSGAAIPGLYAAGNTSASFTAGHYPAPGVPIGSAMAFSHRAVRHMVGDDPGGDEG